MIKILKFEDSFTTLLLETHALLTSSNLTIHPSVSRVILHGSRGLARRSRLDSDIDLSLIVESEPSQPVPEYILQEVFNITKQAWKSNVELDLAVVFDIQECGLPCFDHSAWNDQICQQSGMDCFGLYKIGKGFNGLAYHAGVEVKRMYPCVMIWQRKETVFASNG